MLVSACLFLSGFAALLYETAWVRRFGILFGTSEIALSVVLSVYMGGLALGARLAAPWVGRIRRPILWYAVLELAIGLWALAVPWFLRLAARVLVIFLGGQPHPVDAGGLTQVLLYSAVSFLILAPPTACMGATLPLLARHVMTARASAGQRVGWLYAVNTVGAVGGTFAAGFWLMPAVGLRRTVLVGAATGGVVFVLAALAARRAPAPALPDRGPDPTTDPAPAGFAVLPIMAVSGALVLGYEVLWTRMLIHRLGGTIYAFSAMLASFLAGIALGSAIAARLARSRRWAAVGLPLAVLGVAAASMFTYGRIVGTPGSGDGHLDLLPTVTTAVMVLLPATLFAGATFPFAVAIRCRDPAATGRTTGEVYAWNTAGAIVGALATGQVLLPWLGLDGAARLLIVSGLILATLVSVVVRGPRRLPVATGVVAAALLVCWTPADPTPLLSSSPLSNQSAAGTRYVGIGRGANVIVIEESGGLMLTSNGLPEATIPLLGEPPWDRTPAILSALAVTARPSAARALVVGYGSGRTVSGLPPSVAEIDVVELEPEVIRANRACRPPDVPGPLGSPRVRLVLNDARSALRLTTKRYDIVISQPSHPWTAGASHLYTQEFYRLVHEHLNPGGVFVQWMHLQFASPALLRSLGATLGSVFDNVRLHLRPEGALVFLASDAGLAIETAALPPEVARHLARSGLGTTEQLAITLALDPDALARLCAGAPVCSDDLNLMAAASSQVGQDMKSIDDLLGRHDPLARPGGALQQLDLDRTFIVTTLCNARQEARAIAVARATRSEPERILATCTIGLLQETVDPSTLALLNRIVPQIPAAHWALALHRIREGQGAAVAADDAGALPASLVACAEANTKRDGRRPDLPALDRALAGASLRDPWYLGAVRLRIQWRVDSGTRAHLTEALALCDAVLGQLSYADDLLTRMEIAVRLELWSHVVETGLQLVRAFQGAEVTPVVTDPRIRALSATIDSLDPDAVEVDPGRLRQLKKTWGIWP